MTGRTTLESHRFVLVNKWPLLVGMSLEAGGILGVRRPQLAHLEAAMGIVAVGALHQTFTDSVMESARELLLNFVVAAIAECGLLLLHQKLGLARTVRVMAAHASDVVLQVNRAAEIGMLL